MKVPSKLPKIKNKNFIDFILSSKNSSCEKTYDFVDFFSGCGGMSYGFYKVGEETGKYRHIASFDFDKYANQTYEKNFGSKPYEVDLSKIEPEEINKLIDCSRGEVNNPLVVIGCAPCQGFSSHKKKDPRKDKRNTFVGKFAEIAISLNPEVIIMENVPDLLAEKHWKHYEVFRDKLESNGYNIAVNILNFAEYGVPQERFRTVVLASKKFIPTLPEGIFERQNFRTVRDAISHLPPLSAGEICCSDPMHMTSKHRKETVELLSKVPKDGGQRPSGVGPSCLDRVAGFSDVYGRLYWKRPAVTITARCRTPSCGRFAHPDQNRGLSVREAALLQGFPEDFVFEGPFDDKYKQIGNAVPPIFSTVLATHVLGMLSGVGHGNPSDVQSISKPVAKSYSSVIAAIKQRAAVNE